MQAKIQKYGDEILGVTLPENVVMTIIETEDAAKNSGATARNKKAIVENNLQINVPEFISIGEKVLVKTTDASYAGRAQK
jgi:elongation factor P